MSHVLIVGAGPAGASLANVLVERGIEVTLVERQDDFAREFRGEFLMPSGIAALHEMGLDDALASAPGHDLQHARFYLSGRSVLEIDVEGEPGAVPRAVSQPGLLEALASKAAKHPGFALRRGTAVRDLVREDGRVTGVVVKSDAGEETIHADLVIGADGRGSVVRRRAGLPATTRDTEMDVVWFKLPRPADWPGMRAYAGNGHLLIAYRTWDDSLQVGWVILKGTFGELRSRGIERWLDELAGHVTPDFASHLRAHASAVGSHSLLSTLADCVQTWSTPGVLVIGDAAHTMSPVGGQGLNIALRDAVVSANHLVPVLRDEEPAPQRVADACHEIERERMQEVGPIQRMQALPPKLMLTRSFWGEPIRRIVASLLGRESIRDRIANGAAPFAEGITEVRLTV